jgi:hypothetical protein
MLETFYSTAAGLSFTLLGLWWVIVEFKHEEWMRDPARRRLSYEVSLYFLLPGTMSLVSLLALEATFLWRIGFGIAGLLGIGWTARALAAAPGHDDSSRVMRVGRWGVLAIYALIVLLAIWTDLPRALGVPLKPIEVEGIMVTLLVFLGVNFAWTLFAEPSANGA